MRAKRMEHISRPAKRAILKMLAAQAPIDVEAGKEVFEFQEEVEMPYQSKTQARAVLANIKKSNDG